ncbi:MAG: lytic transglycosylase domain-containing protein [Candidatus Accumulibacter sp.]|nr:lytic transglycosylase domain-containing protein [Accumulibacter sp.]
MKFRSAVFLLLSIFPSWSYPAAAATEPWDELFLSARNAAHAGDRVKLERLAPGLQEHELAAYVDYWRLQLDLNKPGSSLDPARVTAFLARNEGDYLAEKMRGDWAKQLGSQQQWTLFDAEYPALARPDRELVCYALQSRLLRGDSAALNEAMQLWLEVIDPPESCRPALEALIVAKRVRVDDVWARIRRQIENGRLAAARYSMNYLPQSQTPDAKTAQAVTRSPLPWLVKTKLTNNRMHRELAALAIARVARSDPRMAAEQLEKLDALLQANEKRWAWGQIGWQGALQHLPEALRWFGKAGDAPMSDEAAQWRVRAALRAENWNEVRAAIGKLPEALAAQPVWIYWLARAHQARGDAGKAKVLFARIAGQPNFYSHLADEALGRAVALPPRAMPPKSGELARIAANATIRRSLALFRLGLRTEGVREWNWVTRAMDDRELLAAATVAERAGVYDRAIAAAERTLAEHDYVLRYLMPFGKEIRPAAREQSLDNAWVYGLIRQESRFVADARSSAGASGLMQLMPATARWVADKIGLKDYRQNRRNDIKTNILLGTSYLRMTMERLDGHPLLASAGYNAGPGRARKWQAERSLEGAIYAETIPFNETRDYVKKVMSNVVYYSALLNGRPDSIGRWLGAVGPRVGAMTGELP